MFTGSICSLFDFGGAFFVFWCKRFLFISYFSYTPQDLKLFFLRGGSIYQKKIKTLMVSKINYLIIKRLKNIFKFFCFTMFCIKINCIFVLNTYHKRRCY